MSAKILVTGATGTIGKALVNSLQQKNVSFVAGVRNPEQAKEKLGNNIEVVEFDFSNPATFERATEGVNKVFLLGPPLVLNLDEVLKPFIDFLKSKNILRVVYISALGLENVKELPFHEIIIKKLEADGFELTVLKPTFFAQNFKNYEWENITERGITFNVAGDGKTAFVDVNDIGAVAAHTLVEEGHSGKSYELTGPELLSYSDAAALLTEVLGKPIVYPNPTAEAYKGALAAAGAPAFIADYMIAVSSLIKNRFVEVVSNDIEKITGKKPTALKEVLKRDFAL